VIQYNYTHENFNSGLYIFDTWGTSDDVTIRYNISENDSQGGFMGFGSIGISVNGPGKMWVYNNTTFNNRVYHGQPYHNDDQGGAGISVTGTGGFGGLIANNLIMTSAEIGWDGTPAAGPCAFFVARNYATGWAPTVRIENNHFQCVTPNSWPDLWWINTQYSDFAAFATATGKFQATTQGDPMITAGGTGTAGYVLRAGSPLLGTGLNIGALVPSPPTKDYFGNPVPATGGYNRGAN
jgi:hypothetical protein